MHSDNKVYSDTEIVLQSSNPDTIFHHHSKFLPFKMMIPLLMFFMFVLFCNTAFYLNYDILDLDFKKYSGLSHGKWLLSIEWKILGLWPLHCWHLFLRMLSQKIRTGNILSFKGNIILKPYCMIERSQY